jgi:hypothetical protein
MMNGATGVVLCDESSAFMGAKGEWYPNVMDAISMEVEACQGGMLFAALLNKGVQSLLPGGLQRSSRAVASGRQSTFNGGRNPEANKGLEFLFESFSFLFAKQFVIEQHMSVAS